MSYCGNDLRAVAAQTHASDGCGVLLIAPNAEAFEQADPFCVVGAPTIMFLDVRFGDRKHIRAGEVALGPWVVTDVVAEPGGEWQWYQLIAEKARDHGKGRLKFASLDLLKEPVGFGMPPLFTYSCQRVHH